MKILFTSSGKGWDDKIDPRFGRTDYLLLYDEEADKLTTVDNQEVHSVAHGAGPKTVQKLFSLSPDVLITGNGPGGNATNQLNRLNLTIYIGANGLTIREAYQAYKEDKLKTRR